MRKLGVLGLVLATIGCASGSRVDGDHVDGGGRADGGTGVDAAPPDAGRRPDAGNDAGDPERVGLCEECSDGAQCGLAALCGPLSDGTRVCLKKCSLEFNDCPRGFQCAEYAALMFEAVCLPVGERCCIDEDADGYGQGAQCLGTDCDDAEMNRHPDAPELCDGGDQDCDDAVDEFFTDCDDARCLAVGSGAYQDFGDSGCSGGACVDPDPTPCGLYTCNLGRDEGDACATDCSAAPEPGAPEEDRDDYCVPMAHCEDGVCEADRPNGSTCDEDSDCATNHCDNGYCCGAGATCCAEDANCPGFPGEGNVCDVPEDCEGSRGVVQCNPSSFQCETLDGVADDSACTEETLALDCGFFRDLYCTGAETQPRPRCPTSCTSDADCDENAHCDAGVCFPDLPSGDPCDEASDCQSNYCGNGFCCDSGDCCRTASDCPGSYGSPAVCDDPRGCQGTRDAAVCISSQCRTQENVPDDSACTTGIVSDTCGTYPTVRCSGAIDQTAPMCPMTCSGDGECDENAHCDGGACVVDLPDGSPCDEASDCVTGHCGNGFCCASGDCCARGTDCPGSYGEAPVCTIPSQCQGSRRDPACDPASKRCITGSLADDDSGCAGVVSNSCGLFPSVSCTNMRDQPANQADRCETDCTEDEDCDPGAFCNGAGKCQANGDVGDPCVGSNQCQGALSCVDGVCCTSSCTGTCVACNVPGALGTCSPVPGGTDPLGECGGLDCSSYFDGFVGDGCFEKQDAPASAVDCNGAGACENAADVCPGQGRGDLRSTCDDSCQNPRAGTCTGRTPGVCDNVNAGNQTCGQGICRVTVPVCVGGSDNTCTPGPAGTESCNDVDDDCDGSIDNNLPRDGYEGNNSCGEARELTEVTTDGASASRSASASATIYPNGDTDYFRIHVKEDGGSDCITTCFDDERSTLQVTLRVPPGAGSYQLCGVRTDCSDSGMTDCITVTGGNEDTIRFNGRYRCCSGIFCNSNNSEDFYIRIRGLAAPTSECAPYTLEYVGDESC